jgi:hypothetical protein
MKKLFSFIMLLLPSLAALAQNYVVALSTTGLLFKGSSTYYGRNDYKIEMPYSDSVSVEDAKNIMALDHIMIDEKKHLFRGKVTGFMMTVINKEGEHNFKSTSNMLTQEMKLFLQTVQPGDKIYFEFLRVSMPDGTKPAASPIGFTIK